MAEAAKKKLEWSDIGSDVSTGDPAHDQDMVTKVEPEKGMKQKIFERFWGTDVHDPVEYPRMGAQLVGGLSGAYAGAELGAAAGAAVGGPIGAGIGAGIGGAAGGFAGNFAGTVAPETFMDTADYLGISKGMRKRSGLNDEELKTVVEGEMLLDMVTAGGLTLARTGVRGGMKAFTGSWGSARRLADKAAERGINLLPVQVGGKAIPRGFVAVLGKFPIVAGPIRSRIHNTEREFKAAFEALPPSIAPLATMDSVSQRVLMDAKHTFKSFSDDFAQQYENVFQRADQAGAKVTPQSTFDKTNEILGNIEKETPASVGKAKASHSPAMEEVRSFLKTDLAPMWRTSMGVQRTIADQSYTQMNTVLTKIDSKIADIAKGGGAGMRQAISRLESLKHSISLDMYQNGHGPFANAIGMEIRGLDQNYSRTMSDLFETTTAKKFGTVKRGGLKEFNFDPNTRTNVDNLSEVLMRGESVSDLKDLQKLVQPRTFKELAGGILNKRISDSFTAGAESGTSKLDLDKLSRNLGIDQPKGKRFQHMSALLDMAGGMKMDDVKELIKIGNVVASIEAPNASTFIARRATMGGLTALVGSFTGAAAYNAMGTKGLGAALVSMITIMGGANLLGRAITDPTISRGLVKMLKPETKRMANKAAALRIIDIGIHAGMDAGDYTEEEGQNLFNNMRRATDLITNKVPNNE